MLFLLFELDGDRYALDAAEIVQVLPLVSTKSIPGSPAWVAGVFDRHGEPVPVIDVSHLALGRAARQLRSTRLVLVRYEPENVYDNAEPAHLLGLIVERATQTRRIEQQAFAASGVATPHARWLGPVASDAVGVVQWVKVQQMLDDDVKALLFPQTPSAQQAHAGSAQ
jgi:chemotaxis-related protein WspB